MLADVNCISHKVIQVTAGHSVFQVRYLVSRFALHFALVIVFNLICFSFLTDFAEIGLFLLLDLYRTVSV